MSTVAKEMGIRRLVSGDLGIEIEVEGTNIPAMMAHWNNERDGSLQGAETAEYVLKKPSSLKEVRTALDYIDLMYKAHNTKVDDTVRAGLHVHVHFQQLTMTNLYRFMTAYLILDKVLLGW